MGWSLILMRILLQENRTMHRELREASAWALRDRSSLRTVKIYHANNMVQGYLIDLRLILMA